MTCQGLRSLGKRLRQRLGRTLGGFRLTMLGQHLGHLAIVTLEDVAEQMRPQVSTTAPQFRRPMALVLSGGVMLNRVLVAAAALWGALGWARSSAAVPPGSWSVGVERMFGASRVKTRYVATGSELSETSVSWLSDPAPQEGYSSPRLCFDYLSPFGLTVGGALGYHETHSGYDARALVFAPRAGYFARLLPELGLWPRAGLTRLWLHDRQRENETAITLELPVLWLLASGQLGVALLPYVEINLPSGTTRVSEQGLQVAASAFF